ncbi:ABC transporter substrate-binding protein [Reinekea sp.]|jgi:branched-chain amino acid transport system substrate-binding protein|uniref:ABC transporter substrate-binding protein n=1 Tax=Reinekea sp. TaxID=1970455 RepID=UPI003989D152
MNPILISLMLAFLALTSCSKPEPAKIGFIAGLSGSRSDVALSSRNGAMLAIEEQNARGGLFGQPIELIAVNNHQTIERVRAVTQTLIDEQVDIIIGPGMSVMAVNMIDMINAAQIPTIGTTITTTEVSNLDDYFFRTASDLSYATDYFAKAMHAKGVRNYTIIVNTSNSAYTEGWRNEFLSDALKLGLQEQRVIRYEETEDRASLLAVVNELKSIDSQLLLLITNSVDTAVLIQQLKSIDYEGIIGASEWAGTDQLIELLGGNSDGIYVNRYIDQGSNDPRMITLANTFKTRFQSELGFPALMAYNATLIAIDVLQTSRDGPEIKAELISRGTFSTVLADVELNQYGDEVGAGFLTLTQIRNGQFITIDAIK